MKIKDKFSTALGVNLIFVVIFGLILLYSLTRIHRSFDEVSQKGYPAYQQAIMLQGDLAKSKNWIVRYITEEDPKKLETWKTNYEKSFKTALETLKHLDQNELVSQRFSKELFQKGLDTYRQTTQAILEKHEDRLALLEYKSGLIEEYKILIKNVLETLNSLSRVSPKRRSQFADLADMIKETEALYVTPLVTLFEVKTEAELRKLLAQKKGIFEKNLKKFDEKIMALFPKFKSPSSKQQLRKAKTASLNLKALILAPDKLHDTYKNEIELLLFAWRSIDDLNIAYGKVKKQTDGLNQLVSSSLAESMGIVESSRGRSRLAFFFFILMCVLIAFLIRLWVTKFIHRPLTHLMGKIKKIGEGQFDVKIPVPSTKDEISDLATSFNLMTDHIYRNREQLKMATQEVIKLYKGKQQPKEGVFEPDFPTTIALEFRTSLAIIMQAVDNFGIPNLTKDQREKNSKICNEAIQRLTNLVSTYFEVPVAKKKKEKAKKAA